MTCCTIGQNCKHPNKLTAPDFQQTRTFNAMQVSAPPPVRRGVQAAPTTAYMQLLQVASDEVRPCLAWPRRRGALHTRKRDMPRAQATAELFRQDAAGLSQVRILLALLRMGMCVGVGCSRCDSCACTHLPPEHSDPGMEVAVSVAEVVKHRRRTRRALRLVVHELYKPLFREPESGTEAER